MTATMGPPLASSAEPPWLADPDLLVPPTFWHCPDYEQTIGPEVADLVTLFGRTPNPEQRLLLDGSFGMDRAGRLTAFEVSVLAARQNLKTGFFTFRMLGKALLLRRPLQIWTAHKESATDQALEDIKAMIEASDELTRRVRRITEGKGSKSIEFVNRCKVVFRPRTGKAGQSMSANDVDFDEYFAVEPKHEGSLLPTLSTRPNAQIGEASSAPHEGSDVQRAVMARGRAAAEGLVEEPRLLYAEWSPMRRAGVKLDGSPRYAPPPCLHESCRHAPGTEGCIADRREVIKLSNPSAGRSSAPSIGWDYLADERRKLQGDGIDEYFRERLSIGVEDTTVGAVTIFGRPEVWQAGQTVNRPDGVGAIGLAMTSDRRWLSITGASLVEYLPDDDPEAEPVDRVLVAPIMHTEDRDEAFAELKRLQDEHDCAIGLDEGGPAGTLLEDLEDDDIAVEPFDLVRYAKGCGRFYDQVTSRPPRLLHLANADLDEAVGAAEWKWVRDLRVIARRDGDESLDSSLLEAGVIAAALAELAGSFNVY